MLDLKSPTRIHFLTRALADKICNQQRLGKILQIGDEQNGEDE